MASNPLLTMSRKGILTGVAEKAERVLSYYLTSNISQSTLYHGQVSSMQGTIQRVGHDSNALQENIKDDLVNIYSSVFDDVDVKITIKDEAWDESNRFDIQIDVIISEDGTRYSLGWLCHSINGIIDPIIEQLNG